MSRFRMLGPMVPRLDATLAPPAPKQADPFYLSPEWRGLVARLIAQRGFSCEDPHCRDPRHPPRLHGDHIVELKDGGAPLDPSNVMLRCPACHARKTRAAARARTLRGLTGAIPS